MIGRSQSCVSVRVNGEGAVSRRGFLRSVGVGAAGFAGLGWFDQLALHADDLRKNRKACILLWMAGGPSQYECFDPKPGTDAQGPTPVISTAVPGLMIAEHWDKVAKITNELAFIRSVTGKEGNHQRATYLLHTGYPPSGGIVHPGIGSIVAKELGPENFDLPGFVSINGKSVGSSFLGIKYSPFFVTDPTRAPDNLAPPISGERLQRRVDLLHELQGPFGRTGARQQVLDHETLYGQTAQMVLSPRVKAFNLDEEPDSVRDAYGRNSFGQGCLMARRLIEAGVTFVEVEHRDWDTHNNELPTVKRLVPPVNQAWPVLLEDLKQRGLLENTLVIWMGEFGRMARIGPTAGREHWPTAWTIAMNGCDVKGGQVIGKTDEIGAEVADRPVTVSDLFCTFCHALGIPPRKENQSNVGRKIKIVEEGEAVKEVFGS